MSSHPDVALRASGLTKRYGDLTAVDDLSFDVRRGEIFGFLGPNGAGKTTSLKMLCGLLRPDAGHVEIDGRRRGSGAKGEVASVGVAPQATSIWDTLTCFEQLDFMGRMHGRPGAVARQRATELLAALGLTEKTHKLGRTLSGGMQRRLNIALALVHQPAILFLDEPQAGLDPQSRVLVAAFLGSIYELLIVGCFPFFILMFFSESMMPLPKVTIAHLAGHAVYANDVLPTSLGVRALGRILNHGAGLADVWFELGGMLVLTAIYYAAGAGLFARRHCRAD